MDASATGIEERYTMNDRVDEALAALRRGGHTAEAITPQLAFAGAEVAAALAGALRPTDHRVVRWLLEQEILAHEARGVGAREALFTLVAALARFGQPSDALLLWRAWRATPDTRAGVDVEQLGRLNVSRTLAHLTTLAKLDDEQARQAADALAWLNSGSAAGAFDDLPAYFLWADERFGVTISGPT